MDYEPIANMLDKTFAWAINRTFSREEAEELTQEVLFQAIKSLGGLRDIAKFDSWYWRLANIQWQVFKRGMAKSRSCISIDMFSDAVFLSEDSYSFIAEEECQQLRRRIAQMSAAYRDIIVMHYYDNLSCKAIAQKLGLPEGTVTYRLSAARDKLKKGCSKMTETALKPMRLNINIMGDFNNKTEYPPQFINDALSQNILIHAYREPKTVEQLSILTGVPAVYIEDRVENLVKREAVIKPSQSTIQTSFLIFDEVTGSYGDGQINDLLDAVSDKFYHAAKQLTENVISRGLETAGRSFDEIMCFLSVMLLCAAMQNDHLSDKQPDFPQKYDGYRWKYVGFKDGISNSRAEMGLELCIHDYGKMAHYNFNFAPFTYRKCMSEYEIEVCHAVLQGSVPDKKHKEVAAELIAKGFLAMHQNLDCTVPVFSKVQYDLFMAQVKDIFADILPLYSRKIKAYVDGYVKLFPKHLKEDAHFNGANLFVAMFKAIVNDWVQSGKIVVPQGAVCDAIVMM